MAETKVMTADGLKDIEDVEVGDYVLAENPETGEQEYKRVTNTYIHEKDVIVHIYVGDEEIETTKEHPFYVEGVGFVMAGSLKEGDILRLADGRNLTVQDVETVHLSEPVYVYNFEVEDYHTYFVSELGVLVHNSCGPGTGNKGGRQTRRQSFRQAKEAADIPKSAQYKHHEFVYDGSTENRIVFEFDVNGKTKYVIEHPFDKNGRGRHFHGADDKYSSPYNKGTYNQYDGHFPEDFNGFE